MLDILAFTSVCIGALYLSTKDSSKNTNKIESHKTLKSLKGEDGLLLSKHIQLSRKQSNEHLLMIAPTAQGKSKRFLAHNINGLTNCSIVVNDPSCELQKFNKDKKTYVFNPFSHHSIGYNPLENCKTEYEVEKMATLIIESGMSDCVYGRQQEWVDMAKPLLTAYMLYNWHVKKYNFYDMMVNIMTKPLLPRRTKDNKQQETSITEEIMNSSVELAKIKLKSFLKGFESSGTMASIYSVMNTCLRVFVDSNLKQIFTKDNFDISKLRKEESCLFIQIPERYSRYYNPVINVLINQIIDNLFDSKGLQVFMLLDEAGLIKIQDIDTSLSTARKKNISFVFCIQTINQLEDIYGSKFKTVRELFKTLLVCSGLKDSAEYISSIIGEHRVETDKGNYVERLMSPEKIRTMDKDKIIIICNNKSTVIDEMMDILY